jgi:crossover junction endodeoxyribonuclease RuvC
MKIIGIDPGTVITGIGIIESDGINIGLINYNTINLNSKSPLPERLKIIYDTVLEKIELYKPDEFAIETAYYGKNIQSTLKLGQSRGVSIIAALNYGIHVYEYSPREIKKSVTGSGASSKETVRYMIKSILSFTEDPKYIDSSDALAVALCHLYRNQFNKTYGNLKDPVKSKMSWEKYVQMNPERLINKL